MTDAPPLHLTLHPTNESQFAGGRYLVGRSLGLLGRLAFLLVPLATTFALGLWMSWMQGLPLSDGGVIVLYSFIGGAAGLMATQFLWARRYTRQYAQSAMRTAPVPISLSAKGLAFDPRPPLPWSTVTEISRWKDFTLVQFSPVDAIVIRDADLPEGLTHPSLAARIAAWKTP
jgi:hypothetical protein